MQIYIDDTFYFDSEYNSNDDNWYSLIISDSRVQNIINSNLELNKITGIKVENNKFILITRI